MLKLEDLEVYNMAMEIGDNIWDMTGSWDYKASSTIGIRLSEQQIQLRPI